VFLSLSATKGGRKKPMTSLLGRRGADGDRMEGYFGPDRKGKKKKGQHVSHHPKEGRFRDQDGIEKGTD